MTADRIPAQWGMTAGGLGCGGESTGVCGGRGCGTGLSGLECYGRRLESRPLNQSREAGKV